MPTISAGASGSYTFAQHEQALISPTQGEACQIEVRRAGVVIDSRRVTTEKVIGPFDSGDVMTLTAQRGAADYTISTFSNYSANTEAPIPAFIGAWADRPAASSVPVGTQIYITDIPVGGRTAFYAGATVWYPEGGEVVLASSGVAKTAVTGTTSATSQTLMTIPGGILGPNGSLIVEGHYSMTNNANSKTLQISASTGNVRLYGAAATSVGQVVFRATMTNRGSEVQQIVQENTFAGSGGGPGSPHIGAQDTTLDWTLRNLIQLAVGTDTVTLERWAVVARPF